MSEKNKKRRHQYSKESWAASMALVERRRRDYFGKTIFMNSYSQERKDITSCVLEPTMELALSLLQIQNIYIIKHTYIISCTHHFF